ncbi:hypothetical protein HYE82_20030 [Streptomyces sp. BR123]|uniref:hypothetical protein n=1 Tax=Streptomyces sp. BR123 TaxID=2749828 RepID=UPI0015C49EC9|nr:hypothetical protein [Streptomyces sp. BR123]NXY96633.1 hypothetical protein [Streptomyces sp. BR123]
MGDSRTALGPLELVEGIWVVGDSGRPGGSWLEFREEGMYRRARDGDGELIPWSRIMLGIAVYVGRGYPSHGQYTVAGLLGNVPGPLRAHGRGHLDVTLRHPYGDHKLTFDRHPRAYRVGETFLLEELLSQVVAAKEAHRLGDPDWLGRAVGRLEPLGPWLTRRNINEAVKEACWG